MRSSELEHAKPRIPEVPAPDPDADTDSDRLAELSDHLTEITNLLGGILQELKRRN
jgi:hypothetical protein